MIIYAILNKINGKMYIGKSKKDDSISTQSRVFKHFNGRGNYSKLVYQAVQLYGKENLTPLILYQIEYYNTLAPYGYNLTKGGDGGDVFTNQSELNKIEIGKKISKANTGRKNSEETKKRMSESSKIRELLKSEEEKLKIAGKTSDTNKRKGTSFPTKYWSIKGCVGFFKGKKHSLESKIKIGIRCKDKTYEELYGEEKSKELKVKASKRWIEDNPNFINFTDKQKQNIIDLLSKEKLLLKDICAKMQLSLWVVRKWLRNLGIKNYQKFYKGSSSEEWALFWESLKC